MEHFFPDNEEDLHIKDRDCKCEPTFILDKESGEMVWVHHILDYEKIVDDMIQLDM